MYQEKDTPMLMLSEADRPREKLMAHCARSLSETELLAILIGSGTQGESALTVARRLLITTGNDLNTLARQSPEFLCRQRGIGKAKAILICAAVELGRRHQANEVSERAVIRSSKDAYMQLQTQMRDLNHEEFWVLFLNRANKVLHKEMVSKCGLVGTIADPRLIFERALLVKAAAIIVAHNHPSGNVEPSKPDIDITRKLKSAGEFLDLSVLDHLIIGEAGYFSFADEGLM